MNTAYSFGKEVDTGFDQTIENVTKALKAEGFGILTQIDVQATLKEKLGEDMAPYKILGACNPPLAHRAITAEPSIGALLPCNVIVRQAESGRVAVEIMDPNAVLQLVNKQEIKELAGSVRAKMENVLNAL